MNAKIYIEGSDGCIVRDRKLLSAGLTQHFSHQFCDPFSWVPSSWIFGPFEQTYLIRKFHLSDTLALMGNGKSCASDNCVCEMLKPLDHLGEARVKNWPRVHRISRHHSGPGAYGDRPVVQFDGASRGNPGPSGCGVVVYSGS